MSTQISSASGDECESTSEPEESQVEMPLTKKRRKRLLNTSAFLEEMLSDEDEHSHDQHLSPTDAPRRTTHHDGSRNLDVTPPIRVMKRGKGTHLLTSTNSETGELSIAAAIPRPVYSYVATSA